MRSLILTVATMTLLPEVNLAGRVHDVCPTSSYRSITTRAEVELFMHEYVRSRKFDIVIDSAAFEATVEYALGAFEAGFNHTLHQKGGFTVKTKAPYTESEFYGTNQIDFMTRKFLDIPQYAKQGKYYYSLVADAQTWMNAYVGEMIVQGMEIAGMYGCISPKVLQAVVYKWYADDHVIARIIDQSGQAHVVAHLDTHYLPYDTDA